MKLRKMREQRTINCETNMGMLLPMVLMMSILTRWMVARRTMIWNSRAWSEALKAFWVPVKKPHPHIPPIELTNGGMRTQSTRRDVELQRNVPSPRPVGLDIIDNYSILRGSEDEIFISSSSSSSIFPPMRTKSYQILIWFWEIKLTRNKRMNVFLENGTFKLFHRPITSTFCSWLFFFFWLFICS